jgi:hypothetical protein
LFVLLEGSSFVSKTQFSINEFDNIDFKNYRMKQFYLVIIISLFSSLVFCQNDIGFEWAKTFTCGSYNSSVDIIKDPYGNKYVHGYFYDSIDVDPGAGESYVYSQFYQVGAYFIKLNSNEELVWGKSIRGITVSKMLFDISGNLVISGTFNTNTDFDPGPGVYNMYSSAHDCFVMSLNTNGDFLWAKQFGGNSVDVLVDMEIDDASNIILVGTFKETADFDPSGGTFLINAIGGSDVFVVKLDNLGNFIWAKSHGSTGSLTDDYVVSVSVDGLNNIYIAGSFFLSVDFDPGPGDYTVTSNGGRDLYINKLDANGELDWNRTIGSSNGEVFMSLDILNSNIYYVARTGSVVDSDPGPGVNNMSPGVILGKLSLSGNHIWTQQFSDNTYSSNLNHTRLGILNNNDIIVMSQYKTEFDFDPGTGVSKLYTSGSWNISITRFDPLGIFKLTKRIGEYYDVELMNLFIQDDQIYYCGNFDFISDFFPGSGVFLLEGSGLSNSFISKLHLCNVTYGTDVIETCDTFTWINGITYTASNNTDQYVVPNYNGCDSVVSLDLTIKYSTSSTDFIEACDSITWMDGNTYTTSNNSATWLLTNAVGCDSVINLDLTLNYSNDGIDEIVACDSFTWIDGNVYSNSNNVAQHTLTNNAGCDSVVTLNLTIINSTTSNTSVSACDTYSWNGSTYNQSGTYDYYSVNSIGCDSIATLNLEINNTVYSTDNVTACESFMWIDGVTYTSSTNSPTYLYSGGAESGCDSIVNLNLTILQLENDLQFVSSCNSYYWEQSGETYTQSGNYYDTIPGAGTNGCDSVYWLSLTIYESNYINNETIICLGDAISVGSSVYSTPGSYTDSLVNQHGCDSIIYTDLYIDSLQLNVLEVEHLRCSNNEARVYFDVIYNYGYNTSDFNTNSETSPSLNEGVHTFSVISSNGCLSDTTITIIDRNSEFVKVTNLGFQDQVDVSGTPEAGLYNLPPTLNKHPSNPRNVIEPGIPVRFKIFVENNRQNGLSINSGEGLLTIHPPSDIPSWTNMNDYIIITDNSVGINNIPWGESGWSSDEFEIIIDSSIYSMGIEDVQFDFTLSESNDVWETTCIHFPVSGLFLSEGLVDDDNLADSQGNNNSLCESMEVIEFTPKVGNGQLNQYVTVINPYGTFENINNFSGISIWDGIMGVNGSVEDGSWWNYYQNQPNPISPGDMYTVPQYDFVFDYNYSGTYEFSLHSIVGGGVKLFKDSTTQTLLKWGLPFVFNAGYPAAPNCDDFEVDLTITHETTENAENGSAAVSASGGTTPYYYEWSDGTNNVYNGGLAPGNYSVIVYDNEVCSDTLNFTIQPFVCNSLTANVTVINASNGVTADGSATATVTGGNPPFNYYWSNGATGTSNSNLSGGLYSLTVVDDILCETTVEFEVLNGDVGIEQYQKEEEFFKIFPNPTTGDLTVEFSEVQNGTVVSLLDINGKVIKNIRLHSTSIQELSIQGSPGVYLLRIQNEHVTRVHRVIKK